MGLKRNNSPGGESLPAGPPRAGTPSDIQNGGDAIRHVLDSPRDAVLITSADSRVLRQYLPALFHRSRREKGGGALLIVPSSEAAADIQTQARELSGGTASPPRVLIIGVEDNPRKESRRLSDPRDILVGTPERLIDHLRRENADLSGTSQVIVHCPGDGDMNGFAADVRFIYSRTGFKPRTLLVAPSPGKDLQDLRSLLRRPRTLRLPESGPCARFHVVPEGGKPQALLRILLAGMSNPAGRFRIRWSGGREEVRRMLGRFFPASDLDRREDRAGKSRIRLDSGKDWTPGRGESLVCNAVPPPEAFDRARRDLRDCGNPGHFIIIIEERERAALLQSWGSSDVKMEERDIPRDDEAIRGLLRSMVRRIKEEENPEELNRYRKLFTGNVSIFLRSYVAAYLVKQFFEISERKGKSGEAGTFSPPGMTTLFFGAGKNRRLQSRDIANLITEKTPDLDPWEIGEIKILDNYSFVDIVNEKAPSVIEAANGATLGGRKILVNYARKKKGG